MTPAFIRCGVNVCYEIGAKRSKHLPPLVFIHGSYHAAWCWAEHWMAFLASKGYETYSISLRGTSGTPIPATEVRYALYHMPRAIGQLSGIAVYHVIVDSDRCAVSCWQGTMVEQAVA